MGNLDLYKLVVGAALALLVFAVVGLMVKKAGKVLVMCGIVFLLILGPMSYAALTK